MTNPLTEKEKMLIGKTVVAIKSCDYGHLKIEKGREGIISDFGSESNDPCIRWSDDFSGFVTWDLIKIID